MANLLIAGVFGGGGGSTRTNGIVVSVFTDWALGNGGIHLGISVHRNPRWQNSAICDVIAATLPANNIELPTTGNNHRQHRGLICGGVCWLSMFLIETHVFSIYDG
jgi:hypothetical protein